MRAAYIEEYGGADKIKIGERPRPQATNGGVLVRVRAAGIGRWDTAMMLGHFGRSLPFIPSSEIAGDVAEADSEGRFQSGDPVFGSLALAGGGTAEYAVIPAERIARKSPKLSYSEAASLVIGGGTAYEGLIERGQLKAGETVLITAAAGGVGVLAVQIAAATGARVLAVAGAKDQEFLSGLGVQQVFDYHAAAWVDQLRGAVPDGVDLLFDATANETRDQALTVVKQGGRAIFIAGPPQQLPEGVTGQMFGATVNSDRLNALNKLVAEGKLKAQIRDVIPLASAQIAFARIADGHGRGKVVISVDCGMMGDAAAAHRKRRAGAEQAQGIDSS